MSSSTLVIVIAFLLQGAIGSVVGPTTAAVAAPARTPTPKPRAQLRRQRDGKQGPWVAPERAERLNEQLSAYAATACVLVDGNNVRGLNGFRWSAPRLHALVRAWARANGLEGRVVVVWDHGACPCAFAADGIGLAFAGPRATADDVIAAQTGAILDAGVQRVWVATSDRELVYRAMAAGSGAGQSERARVRVISSADFAALVAGPEEAPAMFALDAAVGVGAPAPGSSEQLGAAYGRSEGELRERAAVLQPPRLRLKARRQRQRRGRAPGGISALGQSFKEKTWHRVVLAERLRRLLAAGGQQGQGGGEGAGQAWLARYVGGYNAARSEGAVAPRPLLDDRRLDGEGRAHLLRFAKALRDAADGEPPDGGAEEGGGADVIVVGATEALAPAAPYAPKPKRTRRERRVLRSSRARHAGDRAAALPPMADREAALAALDEWLSADF